MRRVGIALGLTWLVWPASAVAQSPPDRGGDAATSAADQRFQLGIEAYERGEHRRAIEVWEPVLSEVGEQRGWKVLFNLGRAYDRIGDATRAIERLEAFLRVVDSGAVESSDALAQARADAALIIQRLERSHGTLVIKADPRAGPVDVQVGSHPPRRAGFKLFLPPGTHLVEIRTGTPFARTLKRRLVAGEVDVLEIEPLDRDDDGIFDLDDACPARAGVKSSRRDRNGCELDSDFDGVPDARDACPRARANTPNGCLREQPDASPAIGMGWVVVSASVTVASLALPAVLYARAEDRRQHASDLGTSHLDYPAAKQDYEDARSTYWISYAVPGVLALVTGTLWVVHEVTSPPASPRVGVALAPSGAQASIAATF